MSNTKHLRARPAGTPGLASPGVVFCLQCVGAHKIAAATGQPAPPVLPAITWAPAPGGVALPTCYDHLAVTQQSGLVGANGQPQGRLIT